MDDIIESSVLHLLHRASQVADDMFTREQSGPERLTPRQLIVLAAVAHSDGISQTEIVRKTGVDRSTLTDVIRRLLAKGLITRRRTKGDARMYSVKLSPQGRLLLDEADMIIRRTDEQLAATLSADGKEDLGRLLQTLIASAIGPDDAAAYRNRH